MKIHARKWNAQVTVRNPSIGLVLFNKFLLINSETGVFADVIAPNEKDESKEKQGAYHLAGEIGSLFNNRTATIILFEDWNPEVIEKLDFESGDWFFLPYAASKTSIQVHSLILEAEDA